MTKKCFIEPIPFLFALVCALFVQSPSLHAQQLATLSVSVSDLTARVVPGAHVTLTNSGTGLTRTQVADHVGAVVVTALSAGD